jgi:hypothetical protein
MLIADVLENFQKDPERKISWNPNTQRLTADLKLELWNFSLPLDPSDCHITK